MKQKGTPDDTPNTNPPTKTRLIINNLSSCTTQEALSVVQSVIKAGRISNDNKQFCYVSTFTKPQVRVISGLLKQGDSFTIHDDPQGSLVSN